MQTFEIILAITLAGAVLYFFLPGARQMLQESKEAKDKDWAGFLIPVVVVIVFVMLLVFLAS
ncbi:MAG: hypothetical protein ACNYPG_06240 [Candidatus Porifericomitaceae bacterium WSBS_2022_MAG_OTU9]